MGTDRCAQHLLARCALELAAHDCNVGHAHDRGDHDRADNLGRERVLGSYLKLWNKV